MLWGRIKLRRGVLYTTLCEIVCQSLAAGWWFSLATPPPINTQWLSQFCWNNVESGVKHHNTPCYVCYAESTSGSLLCILYWIHFLKYVMYVILNPIPEICFVCYACWIHFLKYFMYVMLNPLPEICFVCYAESSSWYMLCMLY